MAGPRPTATMKGRKEDRVHVLMLTLMVALAVCVLLLFAFGLLTHHLDSR